MLSTAGLVKEAAILPGALIGGAAGYFAPDVLGQGEEHPLRGALLGAAIGGASGALLRGRGELKSLSNLRKSRSVHPYWRGQNPVPEWHPIHSSGELAHIPTTSSGDSTRLRRVEQALREDDALLSAGKLVDSNAAAQVASKTEEELTRQAILNRFRGIKTSAVKAAGMSPLAVEMLLNSTIGAASGAVAGATTPYLMTTGPFWDKGDRARRGAIAGTLVGALGGAAGPRLRSSHPLLSDIAPGLGVAAGSLGAMNLSAPF